MVNNISTNVLTIVCLMFFILKRFNIQNTFGKRPTHVRNVVTLPNDTIVVN